MPLQATSGAASQDAFGGNGVAVVPTYIEDVFSCFLYTGNGATQTITNGIDLSTKGGLVWIKHRSGTGNHGLTDTIRGATKSLFSDQTYAELTGANDLKTFNNNGFSIGDGTQFSINNNTSTYVSWTFRKQPKFFDVVTYTGTGSNTTIAHALGSVPACIMVKRTDTTGAWQVYHRSLANTEYLVLNSTAAKATGATRWNSTTPTSSVFSLGTDATVNASAGTYVAYIFAHDAGGFGLTGTDNVISCGSYTGTSAVGNAQTLGYEPQWILIKNITTAGYDWTLIDTMRGWATNRADAELYANSSSAEYFADNLIDVTATGFNFSVSGGTALNTSGNTYIYIAIRRGPMKVPTTGTSVYGALAYSGNSTSGRVISTGIDVPDLAMMCRRNLSGTGFTFTDRLRNTALGPPSTDSESGFSQNLTFVNQGDASIGSFGNINQSTYTYIGEFMRRAPSFMDVVCYTGTGSALTVSHNLAAVPELIIGKNRTTAGNNWPVLFNFASTTMNYGFLNLTNSCPNDTYANVGVFSAAPTSTSMFLLSSGSMNTSANNHVAYLFATCAGVSKVGSYTGTATTKQIDCGFTAGARFVLIKRTDSTGDWYVWDTARGIVSGNDPYLLLNSTDAEVTSTDYIDTYSAGFEISSTAPAAINANGGTYIFLAIA